MNKDNIYLPIEISKRELDYKILLAAELYDDKKRIFIGEDTAIKEAVRRTQNGIFIGKSFITPYLLEDLCFLKELKNKKINIIYIDEEGAVYAGDKENWALIMRTVNASSVYGNHLRYVDFTHELSFTDYSLKQIFSAVGFSDVDIMDTKPSFGFKPKRFIRWLLLKLWRQILKFIFTLEVGTDRPRYYGKFLIACAKK